MIKKNIKYYNRGKSFTSNISINKKDIKILNVEFKENPKNKSKESIEDYYILTNKEYNQMNISNEDINKDKKELNQLKENYNTLNKELEKLTNKYNNSTNVDIRSKLYILFSLDLILFLLKYIIIISNI